MTQIIILNSVIKSAYERAKSTNEVVENYAEPNIDIYNPSKSVPPCFVTDLIPKPTNIMYCTPAKVYPDGKLEACRKINIIRDSIVDGNTVIQIGTNGCSNWV